MQRFKATIAYFGQNYLGFQIQPQSPTIQEIFEDKLFQILREKTRITPSGRTDAGVHALKQVIHFDITTQNALSRITQNDFCYRMNSILPDDISLLELAPCESTFHARQSAKEKIYGYWILQASAPNPFFHHLAWQIPYTLNINVMKEASKILIGEHDFSGFCAADSHAKTKVRHLLEIDFSPNPPSDFWNVSNQQWLKISFRGKGFLKQMVRNLVGTFVEIGRQKISSNKIRKILDTGNRQLAGPTAPAQGLYLVDILY